MNNLEEKLNLSLNFQGCSRVKIQPTGRVSRSLKLTGRVRLGQKALEISRVESGRYGSGFGDPIRTDPRALTRPVNSLENFKGYVNKYGCRGTTPICFGHTRVNTRVTGVPNLFVLAILEQIPG